MVAFIKINSVFQNTPDFALGMDISKKRRDFGLADQRVRRWTAPAEPAAASTSA